MTSLKNGFQSIGVTKDWRLLIACLLIITTLVFPINRRHQGLATLDDDDSGNAMTEAEFPINRRHQGLATALKVDPVAESERVSNQ